MWGEGLRLKFFCSRPLQAPSEGTSSVQSQLVLGPPIPSFSAVGVRGRGGGPGPGGAVCQWAASASGP
jgi:hypothetical protein